MKKKEVIVVPPLVWLKYVIVLIAVWYLGIVLRPEQLIDDVAELDAADFERLKKCAAEFNQHCVTSPNHESHACRKHAKCIS
jgi:hypothetical protein